MSLKYAELFTRAAGSQDDSVLDDAVLRATASTSTSTEAFFAHQGTIHVYDERMQRLHSFPTFPEVRFLQAERNGKLLLVLGSSNASELVSSTCIGFWAPAPGSSTDWKPVLEYQPFKTQHAQEAAVTAWTVRDFGDRVSVVLALHSSPCVILQQDFRVTTTVHGTLKITRLKSGRRLNIDALDDRRDGRITNLCIAGDAADLQVFMTTEARVLTVDLQPAKSGFTTLDALGAAPGSFCAYDLEKVVLAWAYSPAQAPSTPGYFGQLCTYTQEAKAACIPVPYQPKGPAIALGPRQIALVISKPKGPAGDAVVVIDLHNRLELHREEHPEEVSQMLPAFGGVLVIRKAGSWSLSRLASLPAMLGALKKKRMYEQAMSIAAEHSEGSPAVIAALEAEYASFLFTACEPEASMQHFINTIGFVPVSTVVKTFMGMQHSALLARYLEQVHARGQMMSVHVLVLLGLYCQMRESERLRAFIVNAIEPGQGYKYDAEEAINILITGGYFQEARMVAEADGLHERVAHICLAQLGNADDAIAYIRRLGRADQAAALKQHGFTLVREMHKDIEVTSLLMSICSASTDSSDTYVASVLDFCHLYAHAPGALRVLCEYLLQQWEQQRDDDDSASRHEEEQALHHQLLQLYLSDALNADKDGEDPATRLKKAERLLKDGWPPGAPWMAPSPGHNSPKYNPDHALELCAKHRFKQGLIFLYRKQGASIKEQQVYMQFGDAEGLFESVLKEGGGEWWYPALKHFVSLPDQKLSHALIARALKHMETDDHVQPQHVLEVLSHSATLPLSSIRDFFVAHIDLVEKKAAADRKAARRLAEDAARLSESIERTRTAPLRIREAVDSETKETLELPAVHFFCGHAYNEHNCETDNSGALSGSSPTKSVYVCKLCRLNQQSILNLTAPSQVNREEQQNAYFRDLRMSQDDGFHVIARHLAHPATSM